MGSTFDAVGLKKKKKKLTKDALIKSDCRDFYIVTTDFSNALE